MIAWIRKEPRFFFVASCLAVLFVVLIVRMLMLQVLDVNGGLTFLQDQGDARTVRIENIPAHRGIIKDRNGQSLAVSTPVVSIWTNTRNLIIDDEQITELAKFLDMPSYELKEKLSRYKGKQFVYLKRHLSPMLAKEILALGIKGIYGQEEYQRYYPAGEVAAHVVGYVNVEQKGQEGMELAFNDILQGKDGSKQVVKDLFQRTIKKIKQIEDTVPGQDITLSIDLRLQYLAYRSLKAAVKLHNADSGSVVILDAKTGEVLAMVNQPAFNPNEKSKMQFSSIRNRAVTDMFEPGSTMKPLAIIAALESGKFEPETKIDTNPGYITIGRKTLHDHSNYGVLDVTGVITKSSQVGITKITLALEQKDVINAYKRMGVGEALQTGFPGETSGYLPERKKWSDLDRATFSFGHGLTVSVLQLAHAYSVFANDGIKNPVSLLRKDEVPQGERVISEEIARKMVDMLDTVAGSEGTAKRAQTEAYNVGGKTGTTHKLALQGGYEPNKYVSMFAGFAPVNDPRLVAVVMVDNPKGKEYYGGAIAGPVFSEIISGSLRILNVAPDDALLPANDEIMSAREVM
jgi:cell division protein FtsI (penicillin-binding protein 3)